MSSRSLWPSPSPIPGVGAPGAVVPFIECPVCDHANPEGARYCSDCGSPVYLAECPQCDAINDRESGFCYKCQAQLQGRTSAEREGKPVAPMPSAKDTIPGSDPGSIATAARSATPEPLLRDGVAAQRLTAPQQTVVEAPDQGALWTTDAPVKGAAASLPPEGSEPHEGREEIASRLTTLPLAGFVLAERPMRFINEAQPTLPYGMSAEPMVVTNRTKRQSPGRRTRMAVGLLVVLFSTAALAVFAHYQPSVMDRTIATARSAFQVAASPTPGTATPRWNDSAEHTVLTTSQASPATVVPPASEKREAEPPDVPAASISAPESPTPHWNNPAATLSQTASAMNVSPAQPKRDADALTLRAASTEAPALAVHAAEDAGTQSISTAAGSAVQPPTRPPVIERTPDSTPGARTRKAPIASALSRSPTSASQSARRPIPTTTDAVGGRRGSAVLPVPCTEAVVAIGLC